MPERASERAEERQIDPDIKERKGAAEKDWNGPRGMMFAECATGWREECQWDDDKEDSPALYAGEGEKKCAGQDEKVARKCRFLYEERELVDEKDDQCPGKVF